MRPFPIGLLFAVGMLSACGTSAPDVAPGATPVSAPVTHAQRAILPNTNPAQTYAMVARQVRACWFNPQDPVLTRHIFRAEAPAGRGQAGQTRIVIYERAPDGRLGLKAFTVNFEPRRKGTVVTTANHRLPSALGQKMSADVGYWVQGGPNCDGPAPAAAPARGSFVRPSRPVN